MTVHRNIDTYKSISSRSWVLDTSQVRNPKHSVLSLCMHKSIRDIHISFFGNFSFRGQVYF